MRMTPKLPPRTSPGSVRFSSLTVRSRAVIAVVALVLTACSGQSVPAASGAMAQPTGTVLPAAAPTPTPGAGSQSLAGTATPLTRPTSPDPPKSPCRALVSPYTQLIDAPNPADFARRYGLRYQDGRVEVEVGLANNAPGVEMVLAQRYGLTVERRVSTLIVGLAPVTSLCDLSNDPQVASVSPISRPKVPPAP